MQHECSSSKNLLSVFLEDLKPTRLVHGCNLDALHLGLEVLLDKLLDVIHAHKLVNDDAGHYELADAESNRHNLAGLTPLANHRGAVLEALIVLDLAPGLQHVALSKLLCLDGLAKCLEVDLGVVWLDLQHNLGALNRLVLLDAEVGVLEGLDRRVIIVIIVGVGGCWVAERESEKVRPNEKTS